MQDIQDTTRVQLMAMQAIRTSRGFHSEWPISTKGVSSHMRPVFGMEQSISSPLGIRAVPSGRFQRGTQYKKVTTMSFLGYLIQAKPLLNLGLMLRLTRNHFYHSFEAQSTPSQSN